MSDERLRRLEREATTKEERYRWRLECVRQGAPELAGFHKGDLVEWIPTRKVVPFGPLADKVARGETLGRRRMWVRGAMEFRPLDGSAPELRLILGYSRDDRVETNLEARELGADLDVMLFRDWTPWVKQGEVTLHVPVDPSWTPKVTRPVSFFRDFRRFFVETGRRLDEFHRERRARGPDDGDTQESRRKTLDNVRRRPPRRV